MSAMPFFIIASITFFQLGLCLFCFYKKQHAVAG